MQKVFVIAASCKLGIPQMTVDGLTWLADKIKAKKSRRLQ